MLAMAEDVAAQVLAAEKQRCAAIGAEDWAALEEVVAGDFRYTHSAGVTEDKQAWMAGLKGRRRSVEHEHLTVQVLGDVALLAGRSVNRYDEPFRGDSRYGFVLDVLQVWVRRAGRWQILTQHGTKIAGQD
jgi:allantoicase